jgi:flagellar biosynthesis/type III secretory pathway protein FliH
MEPLRIQLTTPIGSVRVLSPKDIERTAQQAGQAEALRQEKEKAASLCAALQNAVAQVEQLSKDIFVSHREQIVRLSLEIAARILAKDIHQRQYDIETIILNALQTIPAAQRITLRLHPDDLAVWQAAVNHEGLTDPENILCIGDWSVGHAECVIETDQGVVEYLIEEQLKQVSAALLNAETSVETTR